MHCDTTDFQYALQQPQGGALHSLRFCNGRNKIERELIEFCRLSFYL
jgi:hypothetical protein